MPHSQLKPATHDQTNKSWLLLDQFLRCKGSSLYNGMHQNNASYAENSTGRSIICDALFK